MSPKTDHTASGKPLYIRAVPLAVIDRIEAIRQAWPHDISFAEAVRQCILAGLDALEGGE